MSNILHVLTNSLVIKTIVVDKSHAVELTFSYGIVGTVPTYMCSTSESVIL